MFPTRKEIQELIQNEPESTVENEVTTRPDKGSANSAGSGPDMLEDTPANPSDVMIIEELVYPYDMTLDMLKQYKTFSSMNLEHDMNIIFRKLYRSARYWRLEQKQFAWLIKRLR